MILLRGNMQNANRETSKQTKRRDTTRTHRERSKFLRKLSGIVNLKRTTSTFLAEKENDDKNENTEPIPKSETQNWINHKYANRQTEEKKKQEFFDINSKACCIKYRMPCEIASSIVSFWPEVLQMHDQYNNYWQGAWELGRVFTVYKTIISRVSRFCFLTNNIWKSTR